MPKISRWYYPVAPRYGRRMKRRLLPTVVLTSLIVGCTPKPPPSSPLQANAPAAAQAVQTLDPAVARAAAGRFQEELLEALHLAPYVWGN